MRTVRPSRCSADRNPQNPTYHNSELTFIILARTSDGELATSDIPTLPMIGDVNIFLNGTPGDQDFEAEAEIMIAGELTLRNIYLPLLLRSPAPPFATSER
jgi:hypothetical protein